MSDFVQISAGGIHVFKWNGKRQTHVRKRLKKLLACVHLRTRCELAEGTTLGQLFAAVDRYSFLKAVISQYSWCKNLDDFHEQARLEFPPQVEGWTPLDYLEIYRTADVNQVVERKKHPGGTRERTIAVDFETGLGLHGVGRPEEGCENLADKNGKVTYSVSATPMWQLAGVPVRLNKKFDVYEAFDPGRHSSSRRPEKLMTVERDFTLLDVLDAVYWDISFYGGPADNEKFLDDMRGRVQEAKELLDERRQDDQA